MKGVSAESTVVLADKRLQKDIRENYPGITKKPITADNPATSLFSYANPTATTTANSKEKNSASI